MPLVYLLYRCPRCGHDPLEGEKDDATCPSCGLSFARGGAGGLIRVQEPSGESWEVRGHLLAEAMEGSARPDEDSFASSPSASIRTAEVLVRQSGVEAPVRWGGSLLGFAEAMGETKPGFLELSEVELALWTGKSARERPEGEDRGEGTDQAKRWPLLEIRAVQTSSSSLQFSPSSGGLVQLRFSNDSPFRWEALLRGALRAAYRREGLGEIVEFQPRIVAE